VARPSNPFSTLPNVFATGFVNLYTTDIEAGIRFYRDLLGFEETFRTPKEGAPTLLRDPDGNLVEIVAKVA
jgi:catechol 2,3-dioxygenase-like lactoylglutathione lyase family enzyme